MNGCAATRIAAVVAVAAAAASCGGSGTTATAPPPDTSPAPVTTDASGRTTFQDPAGDGTGGGPDLVSVTVADTPADATFAIRFAQAPPLRTSRVGGWTEMLLVGIDVPPFGLPPTPTWWPGVDYVAGLHGADRVVLFRRMGAASGGATAAPGPLERLGATVDGATLRFAIPCRKLGDPASFDFNVVTAREGEQAGGGGDAAPSGGTFHYDLTP